MTKTHYTKCDCGVTGGCMKCQQYPWQGLKPMTETKPQGEAIPTDEELVNELSKQFMKIRRAWSWADFKKLASVVIKEARRAGREEQCQKELLNRRLCLCCQKNLDEPSEEVEKGKAEGAREQRERDLEKIEAVMVTRNNKIRIKANKIQDALWDLYQEIGTTHL